MYDHGFGVLKQYDIEAETVVKIRGGFVVKKNQEMYVLKEFHGSKEKLLKQQTLLKQLEEHDFSVDSFVENNQGEFVSQDCDEILYTLQKWQDGKECDIKAKEDILQSVSHLSKMHKYMKLPDENKRIRDFGEEFERHNRELRRIQKFIRKKRPENSFEKILLINMQQAIERGEEAISMLKKASVASINEKMAREDYIYHGEYNHHNVLKTKENITIINFEHYQYGTQIIDLYSFMRKIMEKYQWNVELANEMLEQYGKEKTISREELEFLEILFVYPEKYWKLANYYFSHKKVWISEKNIEKLKRLIAQENAWVEFRKEIFY